jgi:hypothetical protein
MTKQIAAVAAFFIAYFGTLFFSARLGRGDSTEPDHVRLQTRQDVASIYGCLTITNGLLAAILTSLVF